MVGFCFTSSSLSSDNEKLFPTDESSCERVMLSSVAGFLQTGKDVVYCAAAKRKLMKESRMWRWCSRWWSSDPPQTASILKEAWGILANDLPSIHQSIPHLGRQGQIFLLSSTLLILLWEPSGQMTCGNLPAHSQPTPGAPPQLVVLARSS